VLPVTVPRVEGNAEADNFRRIELNSEVERAVYVISRYRAGIDFYRDRLDYYYKQLGRIAERLGEPDDEELPSAEH
jgi:hypothetical protein